MILKLYADANWVGPVTSRRWTSGHCTFLGGNLVAYRGKKQYVVSKSSAKVEFKDIAHGLWVSLDKNYS